MTVQTTSPTTVPAVLIAYAILLGPPNVPKSWTVVGVLQSDA